MLVEIELDGEHVAELLESDAGPKLLIYGRRDGMPWNLPLDLWEEAVQEATQRLEALMQRR